MATLIFCSSSASCGLNWIFEVEKVKENVKMLTYNMIILLMMTINLWLSMSMYNDNMSNDEESVHCSYYVQLAEKSQDDVCVYLYSISLWGLSIHLIKQYF